MNILGVAIDERFMTHRLKSTSVAGISGALVAGALFLHHYYIRHIFSWELFAVVMTNAVVKISLMIWYRLND